MGDEEIQIPKTTANQRLRREYWSIVKEIKQLEDLFSVANGLGDSHSAQGISHSWSDLERKRERLAYLRRRRDEIETIISGAPAGSSLRFIPNQVTK